MDISIFNQPTHREEVLPGVIQCLDSIVAAENNLPIPIDEACWIIDTRKEVDTTGSSSLKCLQLRSTRASAQVTELRANYAAIEKFLELGEKRKQLQEVQKRYLKKPEDLIILLYKNIQDLSEEIESLEQQRQHIRTLARTAEPVNDVWRTAAEYFRLVRHGLHLTSNQLGFMRDMMAAHVVFNAEYGPESIMQHWCFVDWFGHVDVELKGWETTDGVSLVGITTTSVTITKHTLRNVFPHLRTTDNSDRNGKLAEQLLHQRLVMHGSTYFEWDDSTCRVTRVISTSDMLTPMLQLLDNLEDVSRVFEQALISPEFQWKQMLYYNTFTMQKLEALASSSTVLDELVCGRVDWKYRWCNSNRLLLLERVVVKHC